MVLFERKRLVKVKTCVSDVVRLEQLGLASICCVGKGVLRWRNK